MKIQRYSRKWPWRCFSDSKFREDWKADSGSITALALRKSSSPRQQLPFKGQQQIPQLTRHLLQFPTIPGLQRKQELVCITYVNSWDFSLLTLQLVLPLMRQDDNACLEMKTRGGNLQNKDSSLFLLFWVFCLVFFPLWTDLLDFLWEAGQTENRGSCCSHPLGYR